MGKVQDLTLTDELHDIVQVGIIVEDMAKIKEAMDAM